MAKMGQNLSDDELTQMIASVDKDKNGMVDYKEFEKMMGVWENEQCPRRRDKNKIYEPKQHRNIFNFLDYWSN